MKALADTDEEEAFYYAYGPHVISDKYEGKFGAAVKSKTGNYALEFYVGKIVVTDGNHGKAGIGICADLMVEAYMVTFPGSEWQPTASQINFWLSNHHHKWKAINVSPNLDDT